MGIYFLIIALEYSIIKSTKSLMFSKDSAYILDTCLRILRQSTPWTMATGMHSTVIACPAHFFALLPFICIYNQHTQQFARWLGDSHVTPTPTRAVRHVGCRIVYERSRQKRQLNKVAPPRIQRDLGGLVVIPQEGRNSR